MFCLKKASTLFFFLLFSVECFAGYDREKRISELEKQMMEVGAYNRNQSFGAVFGPSKVSHISAEIFVDLLLFKANVGATEFICTYPTHSNEQKNSSFSSRINELSFDWDFGFRVGFTKENIYQDCGLSLIYTYFRTKGSEGQRQELPASFVALSSFLEPNFSTKTAYHIGYQNLDLELSKGYFISEKILFHSFAGLKGCQLNQKQKSFYSFSLKNPTKLSFSSKLEDKCYFLGIGPKVGFLSRWYIFKELSFLNKTTGALLYGYYKLKDEYKGLESSFLKENKDPTYNTINLNESFHSFCPFIESSLGFSWNRAFSKERMMLTISCLYEILYFWRQNKNLIGEAVLLQESLDFQKESFRFSRKSEDISFRGVSFEIELDF